MESRTRQTDSALSAGREASAYRASVVEWVVCGAASLLFVAAAAFFFFRSGFASALNSDTAVAVLLADEVLRKGNLFPPSWYYVNGEIWILAPQVFALPFVAVLGLSPLALKFGNIVAILSMVVCLTLPIQRVGRSWPFSITVALGVLSVFSLQQVDMIYEQSAYGLICAKLALLAFFSLRALGDTDNPEVSSPWTNWNAIFYVLLLIEFSASSPLRAIVYWGVPITTVSVLLASAWPRARRAVLLTLTGVALIVGAVVHIGLKHFLLIVPGVGALQAVAQWPAHLGALWAQLPVLVQYQPVWLRPVLDPTYTTILVRAIFLAGAAVTMFFAWHRRPTASIEAQLLARLAASMFAAVLVGVVVGIGEPILRYLLPPVLIALTALMTALRIRLSAYPALRASVMSLFVLAFCGGGILLAAALPKDGSADCSAPGGICRFREALQQLQLHKGYATYWNANVTTLAARGDIDVCGVRLQPRLAPLRWLVSKDCFDPPQKSDRYFIALATSQTTPLDRQNVIADAGPPDSITKAGDYEIWIYEAGIHRVEWLRR